MAASLVTIRRRAADQDLRDLECAILKNANRLAGTHPDSLPVARTLDHCFRWVEPLEYIDSEKRTRTLGAIHWATQSGQPTVLGLWGAPKNNMPNSLWLNGTCDLRPVFAAQHPLGGWRLMVQDLYGLALPLPKETASALIISRCNRFPRQPVDSAHENISHFFLALNLILRAPGCLRCHTVYRRLATCPN
jgi:hypothetical protein